MGGHWSAQSLALVPACLLLILAGCLYENDSSIRDVDAADRLPQADWLLMVEEGDEGEGLQLALVDPETLEPATSNEPIDLGHYYDHAVSPDGRAVAFLTWGHGMPNRPNPGTLHVLEVESWNHIEFDVEIGSRAARLQFAADGSSLYWVVPTESSAAHGIPRFWKLKEFDLDSEELTEIVAFAEEFSPVDLSVLPSGEVAIYGLHVHHRNLRSGPPAVHVVDADSRSIRASVELPDLDAGLVAVDDSDGGVSYEQYTPGLAWDEREELLYIVQPSVDRVIVVDLEAGEVRSDSAITERRSFLDRLISAFADSAKAKMTSATTAYAVLDTTGDYLYVGGASSDVNVGSDDQVEWEYEYGELREVSTESMEEIARFGDADVGWLRLTPDGDTILMQWFEPDKPLDEQMISLSILDAEDLEDRASLEIGPGFEIAGVSAAAGFAYIVHWDEQADEAARIVRIIDYVSGERVGKVRFDGHFGPRFIVAAAH